jgi:NADPH2:quinone reductase
MKSIRVNQCGAPEVMILEDVPDPVPESGQVLVRIHAAGVNPVDTYIRAGGQGYAPNLPYTPGIDAAGVIEAVGENVAGIAVGDRVYCAGTLSGAYAEKALCLPTQVHLLPENVSFAQGAAVYVPYATAYRALFHRAKAVPGEVVLIHGASGGVGLAAVQIAKSVGLIVIGTAGTEEGRRIVLEQGVRYVVEHHDPAHFEKILELTEGRGVDVILEMLANVNLGNDLTILAKGGRVVVIGSRGDVEITPRELMRREAAIFGMVLMNASPKEMTSIHVFLVAGLANSTLTPVIGKELPLAQAAQAHHLIMESSACGKIVLIP